MQSIASKGGQASHQGGFASMDPDKQVCSHLTRSEQTLLLTICCSAKLRPRAVKPLGDLLSPEARKLKRRAARVGCSKV